MDYCSFVYPNKKFIIHLERIQWKACRIMSGCMNSTHTQTLEVITAIPPLKMRFESNKKNKMKILLLNITKC